MTRLKAFAAGSFQSIPATRPALSDRRSALDASTSVANAIDTCQIHGLPFAAPLGPLWEYVWGNPDWLSSARQAERTPHKGPRNENCCPVYIDRTGNRLDRMLLRPQLVWLLVCHRAAVRAAADLLQRAGHDSSTGRSSAAGCDFADGRLGAGRLAAMLPLPVPVGSGLARRESGAGNGHNNCTLIPDPRSLTPDP